LPTPSWTQDWFTFSSQADAASFRELFHNLDVEPAYVQVTVQIQATEGNNNGFIFEGIGSAQVDDDSPTVNYGGVVFAYDSQLVQLWAPNVHNGNSNGRIIWVGDGWGGDINAQDSSSALVRVRVWGSFCPTSFDSGWFKMSSQQEAESYREVKHYLNQQPFVRVLTKHPVTNQIFVHCHYWNAPNR